MVKSSKKSNFIQLHSQVKTGTITQRYGIINVMKSDQHGNRTGFNYELDI